MRAQEKGSLVFTMKANRASRRDDAGEVGVGTLIVFIAMVLVAAVAAAVLISTAGNLQQRAQATGMEATAEVSSNLQVTSVYGQRNDTTSDEIYDVKLQVELSSGATAMDLTTLIIRFTDGSTQRNYNHSEAALTDGNGVDDVAQTWFNATWLRGQGTNFVMQSGDLVEIHFNTYDTGLEPRQAVALQLLPETGASVLADFRTPATYANDIYITLR